MPDRAADLSPDLALDPPEASTRTATTILFLGVGFDLAFNGQRPGASIPLFIVALIAAIRGSTHRSLETDVLLGTSSLFALFTAFRASEGLIALDLITVSILLLLAATQDTGRFATGGLGGIAARVAALRHRVPATPRYIVAPLSVRRLGHARWRSFARVLAISAPIFGIFIALLATGDRVFGRLLFDVFPSWDPGTIVGHLLLILVGGVLIAVLWRIAAGDRRPPSGSGFSIRFAPFGFAEWVTVLAGIDLLFGAFVVVQLTYLFGGGDRVLVTPGLTYAEYARTGFGQLAAAAALTVLVILGAWDLGRRESAFEHRAFKLLVTGMVALDGVVLASALTRLALYEGRFGFTMKRFAGYVAIGGIGAVLVALVLMIWIERRDVLVASIMAVVAATVLVANVMNPERFVATRNVARYQATSRIDVNYLAFGLGPDAIPVTAPLLRNLSPEEAATLLAGLCAASAELDGEPGWRSANAGRANARAALRAAGIDRHRCELVSRDAKTLPPGVSG